jgi:hypothetical protein
MLCHAMRYPVERMRKRLRLDTLPRAGLVVNPTWECRSARADVETEASALAVLVNPDRAAESIAGFGGADIVLEASTPEVHCMSWLARSSRMKVDHCIPQSPALAEPVNLRPRNC